MALYRTTFNLTQDDKAHIARIKQAHAFPTDTAALRFALAQVADDAEYLGIGAAAISHERAYRNLLETQRKVREAATLTPDEQVHIIPNSLDEAATALCGKSADMCGDIVDADDAADMAIDGLCAECDMAR